MKGFVIVLSLLLLLPATNSNSADAATIDIEKKIGQMLMVCLRAHT